MKQYTHLYETKQAHDADYNGPGYYKPWVALTIENKNVTYNKRKRRVTLTSGSESKVYDGEPLTFDEVTVSGDGFAPGEGATYDFGGTQTLIGSSENIFTYTLNEGTSADNYIITCVEGTLTVTDGTGPDDDPIPDDLVVNAVLPTDEHGEEITYGYGETISATVDVTNIYNEQKALSIETNDGVQIGYVPTSLDAGQQISVNAQHVVTEADVASGDFEIDVYASLGTLEKTANCVATIVEKRRTVILTSADDEKPYNGTALTNHDITVSGDGFKTGDGASYVFTGSETLVGESRNTFEYTLNEGTSASDYKISKVEGMLTVTDEDVDDALVIVANAPDRDYDLGETITFGISGTNIYATSETMDLSAIDGVTLETNQFYQMDGGVMRQTTADYTVTQSDILAGSFRATFTAYVGRITKYANVTVTMAEPNGEMSLGLYEISSPSGPNGYTIGETITFSGAVDNIGNLGLTDIEINCELASRTWIIGSLRPGQSSGWTFDYEVQEEDILGFGGELINAITANATSPDPDNPDVTGDAECLVQIEEPNGHLWITTVSTGTPTGADDTYALGDEIEYTTTVLNDGNLTITDIEITCELTESQWPVNQLEPGESTEFTHYYYVGEHDILAGEVVCVVNGVGVSPDPDNPDCPIEPGECPDPTEEPSPAIDISFVDEEVQYAVGDTISYTGTVTNSGNVTITGIQVSSDLIGDIGDPFDLEPGQTSDEIECSHEVTSGDISEGYITNVFTATGTEPVEEGEVEANCTVESEAS